MTLLDDITTDESAAETGQVRIRQAPLWQCQPSPENDRLYKPVDADDPAIQQLADSIAANGVMEPLVLTADHYIVSGHRRHVAAGLAGLETVPVRDLPVRRSDDLDAFVRLLREHNRQREKTRDERLREAVVETDPDAAYETLLAHRRAKAVVGPVAGGGNVIVIRGTKVRSKISPAKKHIVAAVTRVVNDLLRDYWPLSDRRIHYELQNDPPLRHAGKPDSRYVNDRKSYKDLCDLLTRMRLVGLIHPDAIDDETRPVVMWDTFDEPGAFVRRELDGFLSHYARNLMASQPHYIELLGEKNTLASILRPVVSEYTITLTTGRGSCSYPPRYKMAERFKRSGKDKLVLLTVGDLDPEGENIPHAFARSMRDDFGIENIHPIKVAITAEHVRRFRLPQNMEAKKTSSLFKQFKAAHGEFAYEVEALPPLALQQIVREAINSVIDVSAFNAEVEAEKADAAYLASVRRVVHETLAGAGIGGGR